MALYPPPARSLDSYHNILPPILASKVTLLLLPTCTILPFSKDLVDHCQQRGEQAAADYNHSHTHTVERTIHRARLWANSMHWSPNMLCFTPLHKLSVDVSLKASMLDCTQSSTVAMHFFKIRENVYPWKLLLCTILLVVLNLLLPLSDNIQVRVFHLAVNLLSLEVNLLNWLKVAKQNLSVRTWQAHMLISLSYFIAHIICTHTQKREF